MAYPSSEETRGYLILLLQKKPLTVPELCVNLFPAVLKGLQKEFGTPLNVTWEQVQLAQWINEKYPVEWIIVCQGCDDLLEDGVAIFNTMGLLELTDGFKRLGKKF